MVRIVPVVLLASCLAVTAFSLDRPTRNRIVGQTKKNNNLQTFQQSSQQSIVQHGSPKFLQASMSSEIVAEEKKETSFIDKIWNDNTKIGFYLSVWYLGNIACKFLITINLIFFICLYDFNVFSLIDNIYNKKASNALGKNALGAPNLTWALSAAQVSLRFLNLEIFIDSNSYNFNFHFFHFVLHYLFLMYFIVISWCNLCCTNVVNWFS